MVPTPTAMANREKIVILNAGLQYATVIDRKVRELLVESDVLPLNTPATKIKEAGYKAIIVSEGPKSVRAEDAPYHDVGIYELGVPVLGIGYGMQLMNKHFGGSVAAPEHNGDDDGQWTIEVDTECLLFKGLDKNQEVLLTQGDAVNKVADGFRQIAEGGTFCAAICNDKSRLYGVKFHPETDCGSNGKEMLRNFLYDVAGLSGKYTMAGREEHAIEHIRNTVGSDKKVLVMISGGVDSTVAAVLLGKALGPDRVIALHIDSGFLRKNESRKVVECLKKVGIKPVVVNGHCTFSEGTTYVPLDKYDRSNNRKLCNICEPDEKRQIIRKVFASLADEAIAKLKLTPADVFLGQVTLRPDVIESTSDSVKSSHNDVTKSHHNDLEMVRRLRAEGRVVEPLGDFYKDEVRTLGRELGLAHEFVMRHTFPGPGLAVRVLCADEPFIERDFNDTQVLLSVIVAFDQKLRTKHAYLCKIENVVSEEERKILRLITSKQELAATLLPIRSVGVEGDCRSYKYAVGISSEAEDEPNWDDLMFLASLIPKICRNVNRVCYVFGGLVTDPVREITPTHLTKHVLATLRQCDDSAFDVLMSTDHIDSVSQMPVILLPLHFDRDMAYGMPSCQRSVVLRPVYDSDFMTGMPAVPGKQLPVHAVQLMAEEIINLSGISRVLYDLTSKPPGTLEWE